MNVQDVLAAYEEVTVRLKRGKNRKWFLRQLNFFLKNTHLWTPEKKEVMLPSTELIRVVQAGAVWQKLGQKVFGATLPEYLYGTDSLAPVPHLSTWPEAWSDAFDRDILVDGRIVEKVGLVELFRLLGLAYNGTDATPVPHDANQRVQSGIRWMRCQDGRRNHSHKPDDCRNSFKSFEVGLDVVEGTAVYTQDPLVIKGHYMDLTASVHAGNRSRCATLGDWHGGPRLLWNLIGFADPRCGTASRGEC